GDVARRYPSSVASPNYASPSSPRVAGWVTVPQPPPPLYGRQVEIIRVRRRADPALIIGHLDGYHGAIAASWTTSASAPGALPAEKPPVLDLEGLHLLAHLVEHLQQRSHPSREDQL